MAIRTQSNFHLFEQYFIEETGLYYNWWRWYGSETGRYLQKDKIRTSISERESGYIYVKNNSQNNIDILGLFCIPLPPKTGEWEDANLLGYKYKLQTIEVDIAGNIVSCWWQKVASIQQKREVRERYFCCEKLRDECKDKYELKCYIKYDEKVKYEYRKQERILDAEQTIGIVLQGAYGKLYCCPNPWSGIDYCFSK